MADTRNPNWGGRREGGGRKPLGPEKFVKLGITVSPEDADYARALGNGNLSAGIRALIQEHRARHT